MMMMMMMMMDILAILTSRLLYCTDLEGGDWRVSVRSMGIRTHADGLQREYR